MPRTPDQLGGASSADTCSGVLAIAPSWCTQRFSDVLDTGRPALGSSKVANVRYEGMPCTYRRTASRAKSSVKLAPRPAALLGVVKLVRHLAHRNLCSGLSGPATPMGA